MPSAIPSTPYQVPQEPGRWRALTLAALVHGALLGVLWIGVQWQSETPVTIEAEVWSPQTREAAPRPEPVPEPKPEPAPVIKETPKPVAPEPPVARLEPKPDPKPDIALEQEKKRKALEQKKREEEERLAELKQKRLAQEKADKAKAEKERLEREKAEQLLAEKKKAEREKAEKEKAEQARKLAADKKRKEEQERADAEVLEKIRNEEMRRIAGGVTGSGGTGDAQRSQGNRGSAEYAQRVGAKIRSNINFNVPDDLSGNPPVEYAVDLLPDGSISGIRKVKSSGVPGFDDAVRRAIERSQPFPKDKSGAVPSSFIGIHKPKDQ